MATSPLKIPINSRIYTLVMTVLRSQAIRKETKDEITRYYLLPKNITAGVPLLAEPDSIRAVQVKRPTAEDLKLKNDPKAKLEDQIMEKTFKGLIGKKKGSLTG